MDKVDHWALGCLLFELHFQQPLETNDVMGSLQRALTELNLPKTKYCVFGSLITELLEHDPKARPSSEAIINHPFFDKITHVDTH